MEKREKSTNDRSQKVIKDKKKSLQSNNFIVSHNQSLGDENGLNKNP